jgi:hypothetical protein
MRTWGLMLGGLLVWTADFFLLYGIASIFLTTPIARILAIIVTVGAVAANLWLMSLSWKRYSSPASDLERWAAWIGLLGAAVSAVAVVWQGLPAILG